MNTTPEYSAAITETLEIQAQLRARNIRVTFNGRYGHIDTSRATDTTYLTLEMRNQIAFHHRELVELMPWRKDGRYICGCPAYHEEALTHDPDEGYAICTICWPKQFRPHNPVLDLPMF